jgi:hypothetical protein
MQRESGSYYESRFSGCTRDAVITAQSTDSMPMCDDMYHHQATAIFAQSPCLSCSSMVYFRNENESEESIFGRFTT